MGRVAARARHARCSLPAVCPAGEPWPCVRAGQVAQGDRGLLPLPLRVTSVGTWQPEGSGAGRLPAGPLRVGGVCRAGCVPAVPGAAAPGPFHPETTALPHPSLPPFSPQGCAANFSSLMGYQYHQKRCGKQLAEADKPVFSCPHCGKKYKSKAGHDYHVRSEHPASVSPPDTSAARGTGPALPVGDCRAAEPVGRTEPGRAGPGKAGADVGLMLFSPFSSPHACVVPCSVGGERATAPFAHPQKAGSFI